MNIKNSNIYLVKKHLWDKSFDKGSEIEKTVSNKYKARQPSPTLDANLHKKLHTYQTSKNRQPITIPNIFHFFHFT